MVGHVVAAPPRCFRADSGNDGRHLERDRAAFGRGSGFPWERRDGQNQDGACTNRAAGLRGGWCPARSGAETALEDPHEQRRRHLVRARGWPHLPRGSCPRSKPPGDLCWWVSLYSARWHPELISQSVFIGNFAPVKGIWCPSVWVCSGLNNHKLQVIICRVVCLTYVGRNQNLKQSSE